MNILAAITAFILCTAYGMIRCTDLKKRSRLLSELKRLTVDFAVAIRFTSPTLDELAESCCGVFGDLLRCCRKNAPDIRSAWAEAATQLSQCSFCGREESEILFSLGRELGTCPTQGQLSLLELHETRLNSLCAQAEQAAHSKGKLYRSVGMLLGAGMAILII